jgi:hypothetical protein
MPREPIKLAEKIVELALLRSPRRPIPTRSAAAVAQGTPARDAFGIW